MFCNFLHQSVKFDGFHLTISLQRFKVVRICNEKGLNEGCERDAYLHSSGINFIALWIWSQKLKP
jgi:hypothetical protein